MRLVEHWTDWPMVAAIVCLVGMIFCAFLEVWEFIPAEASMVFVAILFLAAMILVVIAFFGLFWRFRK